MTANHFKPYSHAIVNCISSCHNNEQLYCCFDMIYRFNEVFKFLIEEKVLEKVTNKLYEYYNTRQAEIAIM